MDKILRPERFDAVPSTTGADKAYTHWKRTFDGFLSSITSLAPPATPADGTAPDPAAIAAIETKKLNVLVNFISSDVYEYIAECNDFTTAITTLETMYIVPKNEIFSRHLLATRKQQPSETLDSYLNALKLLAKDCQFEAVTREQHKNGYIRDSFINGLVDKSIRSRLLENRTLELNDAFDQARSLEIAQKSSSQYDHQNIPLNNAVQQSDRASSPTADEDYDINLINAMSKRRQAKDSCFYCGKPQHNRERCPAKDEVCYNCEKTGHRAIVCRSKKKSKSYDATRKPLTAMYPCLATIKGPECLKKAVIPITINKKSKVNALIDTGSSDSYIHKRLVEELQLPMQSKNSSVSMAESSLTVEVLGSVTADLTMEGNSYECSELAVLDNLCTDVIVGQDILCQHKDVVLKFGGIKPTLSVCNTSTMKIEPISIFNHLKGDVQPIKARSRRYSAVDRKFIDSEVKRLLKLGRIEPSKSPWRSQLVITSGERHRKRMTVDYSETINKYSLLDAYPLPRIEEQINEISKNSVFSTIDLKEAYYQIPILEKERIYTAFEANNGLYQFTVLPNGVNNGVPCFQRSIEEFVRRHGLNKTFPYLDNVTVCGMNQEEHDKNYNALLAACKKDNVQLNHSKTVFSVPQICVLGYQVSHSKIQPDPARLQPLKDIPPPENMKLQKKTIGLFAYYSKWINDFSTKIKPLSSNTVFPLSGPALTAFNNLKTDIEDSVVATIDEDKPFLVETDASNVAIAATLNQEGRPVAFFSRSLSPTEVKYPSIEKEACAIIEAIRYWKHYLSSKHFTLITDQNSVRFMFDKQTHSKIKNDKIDRWRVEMACYDFDILYRPGEENVPADSLTRLFCTITSNKIYQIHDSLCHPGVTRTIHYLKQKNIASSVDEVRTMISNCRICQECKPRFAKNDKVLIKATQPLERVSIDFKGPLPSVTKNKYFLTVTDEFSRFPFAIPCSDLHTQSVIKCLCSIFSVFGLPGYVHSDRGPSFMSKELKQWLHSKNVPTSRTTPYNPQGNGQCEKYNDTIWSAVRLACKSRNLDIKQWEIVLPDVLHSIRSLLCTATNTTPHERMFNFTRRSATGESMPSWLNPGPVYLRRRVRHSKHDPMVDEVELLEANPNYAHIRFADGREDTVSLRDLAPHNDVPNTEEPEPETNANTNENEIVTVVPDTPAVTKQQEPPYVASEDPIPVPSTTPVENVPRRSSRLKKGPREKLDL